MRNLSIFILFISFLIIHLELKAQSSLTIKNVSVLNELGYVRISWEYNGIETVELKRNKLGSDEIFYPLDSIADPTIKFYIDSTADAHLYPRCYRIYCDDGVGLLTDNVSTFHLTHNYDSCLKQMNLSWDDHKANIWTPSQFIVNIQEDGNLRTKTVDANNQEFLIEGLLENTNYSIWVETKWQGEDSTSNSNPINLFTEMPASPDYINALSASANGDNTDLQFEVDPNSELDTYKLLKSSSRDGTYDTLETINSTATNITTTDENSNPDSEISFYKLVALNQCGYETTNSDIINNIVLQVENNDYDNSLNWNTLLDGSLLSVNYEIYRIVQDNQPELIRSFANYNDYTDNVESLQSFSQFCYFIRATAEGASEYSQSNIACVYLNPTVYIPEAFTPNGDGINDLFQPVFTFVPTDYEMRIYNRWGNVVFETSNYSEPWDGKEPNGNSAKAGSYIYYIKIKTPDEQIIEKRSNITVIYP